MVIKVVKMVDKSNNLFTYLCENEDIDCSTFKSLISYGFDSNDTLMALHFKIDFPLMTDISLGQKSLLRKIINDYKKSMIKTKNEKDIDNKAQELKTSLLIRNEDIDNTNTTQNTSKDCDNCVSNEAKSVANNKKNIPELSDKKKLRPRKKLNKSLLLKRYKCGEKGCNKSLLSLHYLKKHMNSVHNNGKQFESESNMDSNDDKIDQKFDSRKAIAENVNLKPIKCIYKECAKNFNTMNGMNRHIKSVHLNIKPFECHYEKCGKRFPKNSELQMHINRHKGYKAFKCEYEGCQRSLFTPQELKRHINYVHLKVKLFECDFKNCGKKFSTNAGLKVHKNRHLGYKPFKCEYNECNGRSYSLQELEKHINCVHKNIRPFECFLENCGKRFSRNTELKEHMNRHLGLKPVKCDYNDCQYCCINSSELRKHIRFVHNKERPFSCDFNDCGKKFLRKAGLEQHVKRYHTKKR